PFFYSYMYSPGFSFSIGYWPTFYATYYWPYAYGYYGYPYYSCAHTSAYYCNSYCGSGYSGYRNYYQGGGHPYGGGTLSSHDWSGTGGGRTMLNTGGSVESRSRNGSGYAARGGAAAYHSRVSDLGGMANRQMRTGVISRGTWTRGGGGTYSRGGNLGG